MQQQTPQQEQYGTHHQIPQPMMLCPIQYVYESPVIVPQTQEDQVQQNQVLLNVQNLPPWIQNRQQSQVIYVQQVPNNYQAYVHPHMIQNPIYQPQLNYQIQQPIITQDNRQYMQIPNLAPFNTVQNQQALPLQQQLNNDESEKMPLLTHMLNQKPNVTNNVRPIVANVQTNTLPRTVTQNQQVQTNLPANKGRPRNMTPQIITINPMQQRQFVDANQKNDVMLNISRPNAPFMRPEVPQHIRNKIPSTISVKSVNKPMQLRPLIRPFGVVNTPQNFVYNPNFIAQPSPQTRNMMTNTENSFLKQSNSQGDNNAKPNNNTLAIGKMMVANQDNVTSKSMDATNIAKSKLDLIKMYSGNTDNKRIATNVRNTECQTQTEEKLIRNTVYVQARGRVLTEKEIPQNRSPKRAVEETTAVNPITNDDRHSSNKYIRVEVTDSTSQTNHVIVNSLPAKIPSSLVNQHTRISNLVTNSDNLIVTNSNTSVDKTTDMPVVLNSKKPTIQNTINDRSNLVKNDAIDDKVSSDKEEGKIVVKVEPNEIPKSVDNHPMFKEESKLKDLKQNNYNKGAKIEVLTHVLDGYIIQESNVAFPIHKPTTEKEVKPEINQDKADISEASGNVDNETKSHLQWKCLNKSIESDKEMEFAAINKDNPFANIQRSTVESWTVDELAAHLIKHEWKETAAKLQDEEIDGQSVLLVNRDQLVAIGVCESHAEVISSFNAS